MVASTTFTQAINALTMKYSNVNGIAVILLRSNSYKTQKMVMKHRKSSIKSIIQM